ncbi:MAG: calcium/sodium antiporter [Oceanicaulis sp.]
MTDILFLIVGLLVLIAGGDLLVRGAVAVAERLGVSPLVIGLTLVGFGTSTPELVASVQAALAGSPGIAFGNIVGSNIANILLIVGVSAMIFPVLVTDAALKRDGAIMIAVALLFAAVSSVTDLGRLAGLGFLALLGAYVFLAFRTEGGVAAAGEAAAPSAAPGAPIWRSLLVALGGLALVVGGGYVLVTGAVGLAREFGLSETVIGLTIVAVGTSMPEFITSLTAAIKRQGDVAFGNIVGSNIYNILGIGGVTALVSPGAVPDQIVGFDNLVMIAASLLLVGLAWTRRRVSRWEGGLLLAGYVAYLIAIWP